PRAPSISRRMSLNKAGRKSSSERDGEVPEICLARAGCFPGFFRLFVIRELPDPTCEGQPLIIGQANESVTTGKASSSNRLDEILPLTRPRLFTRFVDFEQDQKGGLQQCLLN